MLDVDNKVLKDIAKGFKVPAQPQLLLELQQLTASKEPDIDLIADKITQDVGISATILKTINSPYYGLARTVADIRGSVKYIGLNGTMSLVASKLLKNSFDQEKCSIELDAFWENTNHIAQASVLIAKRLGKRLPPEQLFSLGLFHDCGIPVMAMKYANYSKALKLAEETPSKTLAQIEEHAYGVDHATIGYYVASSWRLPVEMCQLILRHHDRTFLHKLDGSQAQLYFAILKMAEHIIYQLKHFRPSADWAYVSDSVLTVLDCDEEMLQDLIEDITEELG